MPNKSDDSNITPAQLDAVLRFLPMFEQPGYSFGEWHAPEGQFPFYAYNEEVLAFLQALYDSNLLFVFDWGKWQDETRRYMDDPDALAQADLLALRKLLTTHVRLDRFVEGHLAGVLENGHMTAVLRRLNTIREVM